MNYCGDEPVQTNTSTIIRFSPRVITATAPYNKRWMHHRVTPQQDPYILKLCDYEFIPLRGMPIGSRRPRFRIIRRYY